MLADLPSPIQIEAEKARRSLREFTRQAWHVVEPATPFVSGWHLDCISDHLEAVTRGDIPDLLINMPPRHMKSLSVAVFWPCWEWATSPHIRWLFSSYAEDLSIRDSLKCRRVIQSPWYQERWGSVYQLAGDQNMKSRFENDRAGYRLATGVGGSNTGEGGDRVVVDDPHNVRQAESDEVRRGVLTWWRETMSTRRNNPRTGRRVVVMQRVHQDDVSGYILDQGGNWHHLMLDAEHEPRKFFAVGEVPERAPVQPHDECAINPDTRPVGAPLWPEMYGPTELANLKKDMDSPYAIAGQLQQRPVPREGVVFRSEWFRPLPADFDRSDLSIVQFWDTAFSEKQSADWTTACTVGIDRWQNIFILNVWRVHAAIDPKGDEPALDDELAKHILETRPQLVGVEQAAFRQAALRDLIRRLQGRLTERGFAVGVLSVPVTTDKVFRAQLPAGRAQTGFVFADRSAPWWSVFEAELLNFPRGTHDDQVDALSGATQLALEGGLVLKKKKLVFG